MPAYRLRTKALRERFALATFPEGGVLVDGLTGSIARLNASAARVWEHALGIAAASSEPCVPSVAREARAAVAAAAAHAPEKPVAAGPFHYLEDAHGFLVREYGEDVLRVDTRRQRMERATVRPASIAEVRGWVDRVAPKLLSLVGLHAMHAAAVSRHRRVLAFSGESGAGKTTTGSSFERAGTHFVSNDVIVVDVDRARPSIFLDAEPGLVEWVLESAAALARDPKCSVPLAPLENLATGPRLPLANLWFLAAKRRRGSTIALERLDPIDALLGCLEATFLGSSNAADWRRHLDGCWLVATHVDCHRATMPRGLRALDGATRHSVNSTS